MTNLLEHNRIFVQQRAKLMELNTEFHIKNEGGGELGLIRQEGQSGLKKAARFLTKADQFMTHSFSVYDSAGQLVMTFVRPRALMKSKVQVSYGNGQPAGEIQQQNIIGKIRFALVNPAGAPLGEIRGENWRAWNFAIVDAAGNERARITKKWEGIAKAAFTTADNYMLELDPSLDGPLRFLAFASAAAVDVALKQDSG